MDSSSAGAPRPTSNRAATAAPPTPDSIPYFAGIAAALLGGIAWALIAGLLDMEIGWVAWGIGGLVGLLMTKTSDARGKKAATVAAGCALLGLLVGKSLLHEYVVKPAIVESLTSEPDAAVYVASLGMRRDSSYSESVQAELNAVPEGDTLSDALWERMLQETRTAVAEMSPEARDSLTATYAAMTMASIPLMEQVRWHFSAFDALWVLLAVTTAWGMLAKPLEPEGESPA